MQRQLNNFFRLCMVIGISVWDERWTVGQSWFKPCWKCFIWKSKFCLKVGSFLPRAPGAGKDGIIYLLLFICGLLFVIFVLFVLCLFASSFVADYIYSPAKAIREDRRPAARRAEAEAAGRPYHTWRDWRTAFSSSVSLQWHLRVFLSFFNNKKMIFCIFYQANLTGSGLFK